MRNKKESGVYCTYILNNENWDISNNRLVNNYTNYLTNFTNKIDENFTFYVCQQFIITDSVQVTDDSITDRVGNICTKEKYISNLDYSKYNFNVVKFRTGISNSRKFPELFNSLFDDLNYNNIIDCNEIIGIDKMINHKNLLIIHNKTKAKLKEIKNEFLSIIRETFDYFSYEFISKTSELTGNYCEILGLHKNLLNYGNILYNNNISEINNNLFKNINKLLINFNSSLYKGFGRMPKRSDYDYYSIKLFIFSLIINFNLKI